ncbi:MAG: hypothetical protein CMI67_03965, partial [Pelagibaca sp.]|nr:hypothetical protein [Pelagibaca sp.]
KFDADLAVAARDLEDFGVAKRAGHSRLSFLFASVPQPCRSRKRIAQISRHIDCEMVPCYRPIDLRARKIPVGAARFNAKVRFFANFLETKESESV